MTKEEELRILKNFIGMMPKTYRNRTMNRTIIRDILLSRTNTAGSTSCTRKCLDLEIDPTGFSLD